MGDNIAYCTQPTTKTIHSDAPCSKYAYINQNLFICLLCANTPKAIIKVRSDFQMSINLFCDQSTCLPPPTYKHANQIGYSYTNYNKRLLALEVWETQQIYRSNPWFKYTTINNYYWFTDPKCYMQCIGIFEDGRPKLTNQSQTALPATHSDI